MAIFTFDSGGPRWTGGFALKPLLAVLDEPQQLTLKRIAHVLRCPIGAPKVLTVLDGAVTALHDFHSDLLTPSDVIRALITNVEDLRNRAHETKNTWCPEFELERPLTRRLSANAGWALFLSVAASHGGNLESTAAGMELAISLHKDKLFAETFATQLRRSLEARTEGRHKRAAKPATERWLPYFKKARQAASVLFETPTPRGPNGNSSGDAAGESFVKRATSELQSQQKHESARHRQGVLDRRAQSPVQFEDSARYLRSATEKGGESAHIVVIETLTRIPGDCLLDAPLGPPPDGNWAMTVDPERGLIHTNLALMFPGAAAPPAGCQEIYRPATWTSTPPLPTFSAVRLKTAIRENPSASIVRHLFPHARSSGRLLTTDADFLPGLVPSVKRFRNAAGPFCVQAGVDRLIAAMLLNDWSLVPGAAPYYGHGSQRDIWDAAAKFFAPLGWGDPVAYCDGPPVGSRVVAEREAIRAWWKSLAGVVNRESRRRIRSLDALIAFHNEFAMLCASLAHFCVAGRAAELLRYFCDTLDERGAIGTLADKLTGPFAASLPVVITALLARQLRHWRIHCEALDAHLEKFGVSGSSTSRRHIRSVLRRKHVSCFFRIGEDLTPVFFGTQELVAWWPLEFRFVANLGRHFWACELRAAGILSSYVDAFLRHHLRGVEPFTSTSHGTIATWASAVSQAQESLLRELGFSAISGLQTK